MPDPIAASSIVAQAWRMMELSPISSFADDSPQAEASREQYPIALGMCLEDHDWAFARRLAHLAPADLAEHEIADDELPYQAMMPGEAVALRLVKPATANYRLDGDMLRFDQGAGVDIRYTRLITGEAKLPATFQTAVSAQLAVLLMSKWVKTRTKKADLTTALEDLMAKARKNNRGMSSATRLDGQPRQGDWASEATR